ncbi:zig-11, partial [Pristionchus pacificus]
FRSDPTSPERTVTMTRAFVLAATLLVITVYGQTRDIPVAMGNLGVHYNLRTVISTEEKPLTATASGPIWCQATLNEVPLPIVRSTFVRYTDPQRRRFQPDVNHTTNKASLEVDQVVHNHMGKYRCEIQIMENDDHERTVFGNLMVYSSPFFHTNGSMNLVADELNKQEVTADKRYATEGDPMVIHCPATGYPRPTIIWYKGGELLEIDGAHISVSNNGTVLTIDKFAESDTGEYRCSATNEYPNRLDLDFKAHEASLAQEVAIGRNFWARFHSPYGWIYPLLVILVILLLLFIIIYACAACKRYQHDNYNVAKREKQFGRS